MAMVIRLVLRLETLSNMRVVHCQKGSDPSVYALLYMPNFCSRQNLVSLAQDPVALQRRLGLLRQCLRNVPLLHQRIQVRCRKPRLT